MKLKEKFALDDRTRGVIFRVKCRQVRGVFGATRIAEWPFQVVQLAVENEDQSDEELCLTCYEGLMEQRVENGQTSAVEVELFHGKEIMRVKQCEKAQEIAKLLGETTAETKVLVMELISLYQEEGQ